LSDEEIDDLVRRKNDEIAIWLDQRFHDLARGLPLRPKWGIYSTAIMWGMLILAFEVVVGGGFTIVDALFDSAVAPFVTKGATELFAYR
jgi:hypothetical protein